MLRRDVVLHRLQIDNVLRQVGPEIFCLKRSDNRTDPRNLQSIGGQIHLLHRNGRATGDRRQQVLQLAQTLPIGGCDVRRLQHQSQVGAQTPLDCLIQRERKHTRGRLPLHHGAPVVLARGVIRGDAGTWLRKLLLHLRHGPQIARRARARGAAARRSVAGAGGLRLQGGPGQQCQRAQPHPQGRHFSHLIHTPHAIERLRPRTRPQRNFAKAFSVFRCAPSRFVCKMSSHLPQKRHVEDPVRQTRGQVFRLFVGERAKGMDDVSWH